MNTPKSIHWPAAVSRWSYTRIKARVLSVVSSLAVLVVIFLVALWGFTALSRRLVMLIGRRGPFWIAGLKDWATLNMPAHGMMLPVKRIVSYLFFRRQGEELFLLLLVLTLFVAGFLIGTSWTALLGITYTKGAFEVIPRRLLGLTAILVVVGAGSWHVSQRHEKDLTLYAPQKNIHTMPLATWLADGWRDLPAWRIDLEGEYEQPLTIQLVSRQSSSVG